MFSRTKSFWLAVKLFLLVVGLVGYYLAMKNIFGEGFEELHNTVPFPKDLGTDFRYEESGDFWIIHNFVKGKKSFEKNESMTISTWMTVDNMNTFNELLKRWDGPISASIYASGTDYDEFIRALKFLVYCSQIKEDFKNLVTFHLIFHYEHMPNNMEAFEKNGLGVNVSDICEKTPWVLQYKSEEIPYWQNHSLLIPENLMRNVARKHANTYFVMNLEANYYPLKNSSSSFLNLVGGNTSIVHPSRSIYCFAVVRFSELPHLLPSSKYGAILYLRQMISNLTDYSGVNQMKKHWFNKIIRFLSGEMTILTAFDKSSHCSLVNIFVNQYRPPSDERLPYDTRELRVLQELGYHFVTVQGLFVIGTHKKSYSSKIIHKFPKSARKLTFPVYGGQWKALFL